ncbi:Unknown protein [Striga hermonthica]|uniref:Uncharacterized protein n=1 Tax=Striga hermonthica TaxID=68872 RepID=A0A9N7NAB6_STRHE|nr:Unknown protein [Striga hermonthica]
MGNSVGLLFSGLGRAIDKVLGHPLEFLSGKSCNALILIPIVQSRNLSMHLLHALSNHVGLFFHLFLLVRFLLLVFMLQVTNDKEIASIRIPEFSLFVPINHLQSLQRSLDRRGRISGLVLQRSRHGLIPGSEVPILSSSAMCKGQATATFPLSRKPLPLTLH